MNKEYPNRAIPNEEKYVDLDTETGLWCVFGCDSGHAYSFHASKEDAKKDLDRWEMGRFFLTK